MDVQTKKNLYEVAFATVSTGIVFGVGCLVGKMAKGPVLLTGGLYAINAIACYALDKLAQFMASKFNWNLSTYKFSTALIGAALSTALAVASFALGIFGPVGLGVFLGIGLAFAAIPLGMGLYAKFGKKDMPYDDAVAFSKKTLAEDATKEEKSKLAQEQMFYKFAVA